MRGQAAVEYMTIIAIVLAILLPLTIYVWQTNASSTGVNQAQIAADKIANTATNQWAQGIGSKTRIYVYFPPGYNSAKSGFSYSAATQKSTVRLNLNIPGGNTDVISVASANITGTMPSSPGYAYLDMANIGNWITVTPVT